MKIVYLYHAGSTAPWVAMKYAHALSSRGADVSLFELPSDRIFVTECLLGNRLPVRKFKRISVLGWKIGSFIQKTSVCFAMIRERADCYITGEPFLLGMTATAAKTNGARLVYIPVEDYPGISGATHEQSQQYAQMEQKHISWMSAFITTGEKIAEQYRRDYDLAEKVHVVYNSWPAQQNLPKPVLRKKLRLTPEHHIILYQGGINVNRGLLEVVEAMKDLPDNAVFVILGYGPDIEIVHQRAVDLQVSERVRILPPVQMKELMEYTLDADIGIIPVLNDCRSHYLCNPSKMFEYMAAGLPIATSNLSQLEWYVRTRKVGVVFNPEDPTDIARKLRQLLEDDALRARCAANSLRTHLTEACWEIQSERLCAAVFGHASETFCVRASSRRIKQAESENAD